MSPTEGQGSPAEGPTEQTSQSWPSPSALEAERAREDALRRAGANWSSPLALGGVGRVEEETRRLTERMAREERERRAAQAALAAQMAAMGAVAPPQSAEMKETSDAAATLARQIPVGRPISRILVTFDGSLFSERVLPYAEALARMTGAELVVTYITDRADLARLAGENPARAASDRVASALERVTAHLVANGLHARARIAYGIDPALGVMTLRHELDADLIAIATHARQGVDLVFLGSVANEIVRANPGFTLITPPRAPDMRAHRVTFARILLPLDGSMEAEAALAMATTLLTQPTPSERPHRLTLLYVAQSHVQESDGVTYLRQLQEAIERETGARGSIFTKVRVGEPEDVIVSEACGSQAPLPAIARYDLLLMATHGRAGLGRWFSGSVASHAIANCDTSILLTRSQVSE